MGGVRKDQRVIADNANSKGLMVRGSVRRGENAFRAIGCNYNG